MNALRIIVWLIFVGFSSCCDYTADTCGGLCASPKHCFDCGTTGLKCCAVGNGGSCTTDSDCGDGHACVNGLCAWNCGYLTTSSACASYCKSGCGSESCT